MNAGLYIVSVVIVFRAPGTWPPDAEPVLHGRPLARHSSQVVMGDAQPQGRGTDSVTLIF